MTDREILQKTIEKALNNNWDVMLPLIPTYALELANPDKVIQAVRSKRSINDIIFSHDFAKAFWGICKCSNQQVLSYEDPTRKLEHWQYHLQQMVLEEQPLKYLEKFI